MPSSGVFPVNSVGSDFNVAVFGVELLDDASGSGGDFRSNSERFFFANRVVLQPGREPSYAVAEIPLTHFEETAPAIAGVRGGVLDNIKIGTRAYVYLHSPDANISASLLSGSVVNIQQDLGSDGASLTIFDDRWLMRGVHVCGQFIYQPEDGSIVFRQRGPARFNPHGRDNCMDSPGGPLFAPFADYGREDGDSPPLPGAAIFAARPWRLSDIISYLRRTFCRSELLAQTASFPWLARLDESRVFVPLSLGQELETDNAADPADSRSAAGFTPNDRTGSVLSKAPDLTLEGLDLLAAFCRVIESAGAFALNCSAVEETTSTGGRSARSVLEIVPTKFIDGVSRPINVMRPASGTMTDTAGRIGVIGGQLEEDGADVYTSVVVSGAPVELETRVEYLYGGGQTLEAAWSTTDEAAFRSLVANHPLRPNTPEAFIEACWKYPRVFAAYSVSRNFNPLSGTKYDGFPRVSVSPPILPHLLSTYTEKLSSGKRRVFPYPVSIEIKDDNSDYRARSILDGLSVDDDGTLWLSAHRESGLNDPESSTWTGGVTDGTTLYPRDLRITLSLMLDHRLNAVATLDAQAASTNLSDPNAEAGALAKGLTRQYWADSGDAYLEHLRIDAWPIPESVDGSVMSATKATAGNELKSDQSLIQAHAQRRLAEVGRAKKSSHLIFASCLLWKPGQAIAMLDNSKLSSGSYPLRGVVARVIHDYAANNTAIELA